MVPAISPLLKRWTPCLTYFFADCCAEAFGGQAKRPRIAMNQMRFMVTSLREECHGLFRNSPDTRCRKSSTVPSRVRETRASLMRWPCHHPLFQSFHESEFQSRTKPKVRRRHDNVGRQVRTELLSPGHSRVQEFRMKSFRRLLCKSVRAVLFFANQALNIPFESMVSLMGRLVGFEPTTS